MTSEPKGPVHQRRPPGDRIKKLAAQNPVLRSVLSHAHVLQIIDDHQDMWLATQDEAERSRVRKRLHKQLALAGVNFAGMEVTVHGAVLSIAGDPLHGGSLVVLGIALIYLTAGKG